MRESFEGIRYGNYVHPDINAKYFRLKIRDCIIQKQSEWKGSELSARVRGKGSYKVFKAVSNKLKNELPTLVESGSEVPHFIPKPRNFSEVTRLPVYIKKAWLKATSK